MSPNKKKTASLALVFIIIILFFFASKEDQNNPFLSKEATRETAVAKNENAHPESTIVSVAQSQQSNGTSVQDAPLTQERIEKIRNMTKATLSMSYTAQKTYFAENKRYSTDLKSIGWSPPEAEMHFKMGFINPYRPPEYRDYPGLREEPLRLDTDTFLNETAIESNDIYQYTSETKNIRLSDYERYCRAGCTADDQHFEIMIVVPLDKSGHEDVWIINEKKEMTLVVNGANSH